MEHPCIECLVRPSCRFPCKPWYYFSKQKLPPEQNVKISRFLELVKDYGPMKNYYLKNYSILKIGFGKDNSINLYVE